MAGAVFGATADVAATVATKQRMGQRLTRAYADGRGQYPSATNPHTSGTPEYTAWQLGYDNRAAADYKYETAVS
jgi:hypothetical protein